MKYAMKYARRLATRMAPATAVMLLAIPTGLGAQEEGPYVFATYYECDQDVEGFTDTLQEHVFGPPLDARIESGEVLAWGWLSHRIGGDWRRAQYVISPDRATLLRVRDELIESSQGDPELQQAQSVFNRICPDHDDYIWRVVTSSNPEAVAQARPAAGMTTYYVCDIAREARADEIFTEMLAPILNQHTGEGAFNGWTWLAHDTGGWFRRALSIDAVDGPTLFAHRDAMLADAQDALADAGAEFNEICGSHVDYQWDITLSRPEN